MKTKSTIILLGLLILHTFNIPCFAEGSIEEYKCDLMIKGYEFSNNGLSEAIIKNDQEAIELFVKADININLPDKEGYSALDRALKIKDKEAAIFLCHAGGETRIMQVPDDFYKILENSSKNDKFSQSVQNSSVENQNTERLVSDNTTLIATSDNTKNLEQKTEPQKNKVEPTDPQMNELCELVNSNQIEEVAKIAKNSPEINMLTEEGLAPVHYAIFNDNPSMVHLLLSSGAYVNKKTSDGLTPLDIAVLNDQKIVARVVMEYGGSLSEQVARELMKFGCPVKNAEGSELYDASYEDIFSAIIKIQNKLNNQK
ncbi:MAG: ankyrin repeat domain-containing protein [Candidatus Gastranaerophilaceae bacterium]